MSGLIHMPPPTIMLQLNQGVWVNALSISSVVANPKGGQVMVNMLGGHQHAIPLYKDDVAEKVAERIIDYINHAALVYIGKAPEREPNFTHRA